MWKRALSSDRYARDKQDLLAKYGLKCYAISNHCVGQCVCDDILDERHQAIIPASVWGDGKPEGVQARAAEHMKNAARAAKLMDVDVVTAFTGSSIWRKLYFWPPTADDVIDAGYRDFAAAIPPIFDVFAQDAGEICPGSAPDRDRLRHHHHAACTGSRSNIILLSGSILTPATSCINSLIR